MIDKVPREGPCVLNFSENPHLPTAGFLLDLSTEHFLEAGLTFHLERKNWFQVRDTNPLKRSFTWQLSKQVKRKHHMLGSFWLTHLERNISGQNPDVFWLTCSFMLFQRRLPLWQSVNRCSSVPRAWLWAGVGIGQGSPPPFALLTISQQTGINAKQHISEVWLRVVFWSINSGTA